MRATRPSLARGSPPGVGAEQVQVDLPHAALAHDAIGARLALRIDGLDLGYVSSDAPRIRAPPVAGKAGSSVDAPRIRAPPVAGKAGSSVDAPRIRAPPVAGKAGSSVNAPRVRAPAVAGKAG